MKNWKLYALTLTIIVSGWSAVGLAAELGGLQQRANVFTQTADDGGLCICEKINDSWVCRPVGCLGSFSAADQLEQLQQRPVDRRVLTADPGRTPMSGDALKANPVRGR